MLPVVLVGGLHADARRAAVRQLLRQVPGSVALHHDLTAAAEGRVVRTARHAGGVIGGAETALVNDCACCALRADLVPELVGLSADRTTRLAVVELWDSVEPRSMAEVIAAHGSAGLRLAAVVTAVDPARVMSCLTCGDELAETGLAAAASDRRTVADTWARQLEYAPLLAVAAATGRADATDRALLDQLHPTAARADVTDPHFAAAVLGGHFDTSAAAARQHPATALLPQEAARDGVVTAVWRHRRPFHPERLYAALEELTCAAPRSRGRFWLADRPDTLLSWDAAGGSLSVHAAGPWLAALPDAAWDLIPADRRVAAAMDWDEELGDRGQHLVFTGPGLDVVALRDRLAACLLTDEEYAAGRPAWRRLASAFDDLLDRV